MNDIILFIILSSFAAILAKTLFTGIKSKKIGIYYGEALSSEWAKEPYSFIFTALIITITQLLFTYLAFSKLMNIINT